MRYAFCSVWLLTNSSGRRAVVLAVDADEALQLATEYDTTQWRTATCNWIAACAKRREHRVLALEKSNEPSGR